MSTACLALAIASAWLARANVAMQSQVQSRQQYLQQSVQLEGLYREIVRALAELAARSDDAEVKAMLGKHGISYTVNPSPTVTPPAPTQPYPSPRRK